MYALPDVPNKPSAHEPVGALRQSGEELEISSASAEFFLVREPSRALQHTSLSIPRLATSGHGYQAR